MAIATFPPNLYIFPTLTLKVEVNNHSVKLLKKIGGAKDYCLAFPKKF